MKTVHGPCCPTELFTGDIFKPLIGVPYFDDENHQRAQRINGTVECPRCRLEWPMIENVGEWTQQDGKWMASGWDGCPTAFCDNCNVAIVDTFDGGYVIDLRKESPNGTDDI